MAQDFTECDVILVDEDLNSRQSVKNILHNHGYRKLRTGRTMADIRGFLSKGMPDLLVGSTDIKDGDFIEYVREVRKGKAGNNPFIPIITMVGEPTPELVRRIVESGTDTVIAKPFSTAQVLDRVQDLIDARKKFVIADGYIGPIRRKDGGVPGIDAPNTLKSRANGEVLSFADVENMIHQATSDLKMLKVDVIGIQIAAHVTNLVPLLERGGKVNPAIRTELLALLDITDTSDEKLRGSKYEHVAELCNSLGNVASSIIASRGGEPEPRDVRLLKPLSQAIQACFSGAITDVAQVKAIAAQIGSM
ncbi:MAG: response regulator [Rhodospirillales bacterium]|nr:response regulator [Rhodospirillales bacterium]